MGVLSARPQGVSAKCRFPPPFSRASRKLALPVHTHAYRVVCVCLSRCREGSCCLLLVCVVVCCCVGWLLGAWPLGRAVPRFAVCRSGHTRRGTLAANQHAHVLVAGPSAQEASATWNHTRRLLGDSGPCADAHFRCSRRSHSRSRSQNNFRGSQRRHHLPRHRASLPSFRAALVVDRGLLLLAVSRARLERW